MKRLLLLSFLLLLIGAQSGFAQSTKGAVSGRVTDTTGAIIQKAAIQLTPSGFSAASDALGEFLLPAVTPGTYTISVTSAGFTATSKSITVTAGQTLHVELTLTVASSSEQVVVSAQSGQDMLQAVNEEITSPNILEVMPQSEIVALPNANVADAIGRMPGVTLQRDEGEGVYVQVRGLDPRLTNVTIDGVTIPSPEATIRQVNLATIPADMIQSIELNKTLSANQDADGIGGSVNIVTKTAGERPTFTLETTMGYTPIEKTRYVGKIDTTLGERFGAHKKWGLMLGAGYDYNGRGINDIEPSPDVNPDGSTNPYYDNITLREYRYQRLRWGGSIGADYKVSDHSSLAMHLILSDFKDWGDKWYYEIQTQAKPKFYESRRRPDFGIGSLSLSGNHVFDKFWLHWGSAVSRSRELNSGGNPKVTYNPDKALKTLGNSCQFEGGLNGNPYLPQWSANCMAATSPVFDLTQYTMNQYVTTTGQSVQLNLQEWGGAGVNYHAGQHSATLEFGGEFRNAHKFQYAYTPTWNAPSGIKPSQFQSGFQDPGYYKGDYHNGPFTDYDEQATYFVNNQAAFASNFDVVDTHLGSDPDNFDLIERVSAGYLMNTFYLNHLSLQTGLRIESTQLNTLGYIVNSTAGAGGDGTDGNGNWVGTTSTTSTQSYTDALPSVQARWQALPLTAIRAVYARGISRPNPYDVIPYVNEQESGIAAIAIGNPNEKPTLSNNYDLLLEQQFKPFGLIQLGAFYKQLSNPIVTSFSLYTGPVAQYDGQIVQQNINANNATVMGLEFNWQQKFTNLPGLLSGLGIMANYSYANSHTNGLPDRTDSPTLVGTARHSFNINPSYERKRVSAHMGVSYNGSNLYAYQFFNNVPGNPGDTTAGGPKGPLADNYFYPHLQIDAQAGMRVYRGLKVEFDGLNLNNEVFGFYNGSPQYMTQREYYKPTYSASLKYYFGATNKN
ncbi:MAG: TonB-dependent receptor [Terracidiphilus sp.]|jgi:TonB-dependent receptor